jgi:anti-anti-sigma regulatory factor
MKTDRQNRQKRGVAALNLHAVQPQTEQIPESATIEANRSGEWLDVEELRAAALAAVSEGRDVTVNLNQVDHLDASALQILLALDREQKKLQRQLHLTNASNHLRQWFEYAGATELLS